MRIGHGFALILGCVPFLLLSAPAWSDGVPVIITNDGTDAILVTVYDVSLGRKTVILSQRIEGFATIPVNASSDASGLANIAWTAVTIDPDNRKCGAAVRQGLGDSAAVNVHADAACSDVQPARRPASFED